MLLLNGRTAYHFQGRFVVRMLGLATTDLCTKFEISMWTQYKDTKGDGDSKKGGLGLQDHPRSSAT